MTHQGMTNAECRMTKQRRSSLRRRVLGWRSFRLLGREFAEDRGEDQHQLVGFAPDNPSLLRELLIRDCKHAEPVLGFTRFLFTRPNLLPEFPPRNGIVSLAIVRADARPGLDQLTDQRFRYR